MAMMCVESQQKLQSQAWSELRRALNGVGLNGSLPDGLIKLTALQIL